MFSGASKRQDAFGAAISFAADADSADYDCAAVAVVVVAVAVVLAAVVVLSCDSLPILVQAKYQVPR